MILLKLHKKRDKKSDLLKEVICLRRTDAQSEGDYGVEHFTPENLHHYQKKTLYH